MAGAHINQEISNLNQQLRTTAEALNRVRTAQAAFAREGTEETFAQSAAIRSHFLLTQFGILEAAKIITEHLLENELTRWKREQQMAGNDGHAITAGLDSLQEW